jgi:hypothetical protein
MMKMTMIITTVSMMPTLPTMITIVTMIGIDEGEDMVTMIASRNIVIEPR